MFNLIYRLKPNEIGTGLMSINMEKTYNGLFRAFDIDKDRLPPDNRIWQIQNPYMYKYGCVQRIDDYVFIRERFSRFFVGKKITNGYSYLKSRRDLFRYYLPTIYHSRFEVSKIPSIGYYVRDCRIQSNLQFSRFASTLPRGTNVVTMGTKSFIEHLIPLNVNWFHTYNNELFWKSCSHYFYYRCSDIEDPLPHTLLEAIQSRHRIISPIDKNRSFVDGIDDLLSCVDYDTTFKPYNIGDKCDLLESSNWVNFIKKIASNGFLIDYPVNRPTFRQWILETL